MAVSEEMREKVRSLCEEPPQEQMALHATGRNSLTVTLMQQAWRDQKISRDDPPTVTETYLPSEGAVVIQLPDND